MKIVVFRLYSKQSTSFNIVWFAVIKMPQKRVPLESRENEAGPSSKLPASEIGEAKKRRGRFYEYIPGPACSSSYLLLKYRKSLIQNS